jgi:hypothetical protein
MNKEVGRNVAFFTEVRPRDKMIVGIMGVVEVDVVNRNVERTSWQRIVYLLEEPAWPK